MAEVNSADVNNNGESVDKIVQWVTFQLENETYGINVMEVREVLRYTEIAPVPGAPDYVLGIINLRGNVVTVIDTRSRIADGSFLIAPLQLIFSFQAQLFSSALFYCSLMHTKKRPEPIQ